MCYFALYILLENLSFIYNEQNLISYQLTLKFTAATNTVSFPMARTLFTFQVAAITYAPVGTLCLLIDCFILVALNEHSCSSQNQCWCQQGTQNNLVRHLMFGMFSFLSLRLIVCDTTQHCLFHRFRCFLILVLFLLLPPPLVHCFRVLPSRCLRPIEHFPLNLHTEVDSVPTIVLEIA